MALPPANRRGLTYAASAFVLVVSVTGCDDGSRAIGARDLAGQDSIAARADSMLARSARLGAVSVDSLRHAVEAEVMRGRVGFASESSSGALAPVSGTSLAPVPAAAVSRGDQGAEMSRRAQARGDSMARAAVARNVIASDAARERNDSLRGIITFMGSGAVRQLALQTVDAKVTLTGMATTGLAQMEGREVVIRGVRVTPRDMVVSSFVVREVDGVPVLDGIFDNDGNFRLTDGSGVRRVQLSSQMRALAGTRVWVQLRDGQAVKFGEIGRP